MKKQVLGVGFAALIWLLPQGVRGVGPGGVDPIPDTSLLGTIYTNLDQATHYPHLVQIVLTQALNAQGNRIAELTIGPVISLDPAASPVCSSEVSGGPLNEVMSVPGLAYTHSTRNLFGWAWSPQPPGGIHRGGMLEIDPGTGLAQELCTVPNNQRSPYSTDMTISWTPQTWEMILAGGTLPVEYDAGLHYMLNFENFTVLSSPTSVYYATPANYLAFMLHTPIPYFNEQDRILSDNFVGALPFGFTTGLHLIWDFSFNPPVLLDDEAPLFTVFDELPLSTSPAANPIENPFWLGRLTNAGSLSADAPLTRADGEWIGIPTAILYSKDFDGNPTLLVAANRGYRAQNGTFVPGEKVLYEIPLENMLNEPGFSLGADWGAMVPAQRIYQIRIPALSNLEPEAVPAILDMAQDLSFDFSYLPFAKMASGSAMKARMLASSGPCGYPTGKKCPASQLDYALFELAQALDKGNLERSGQLLASLRERLDGCGLGGVPDANDWIFDCNIQSSVNQQMGPVAENLNLAVEAKASASQPPARLWPNTHFADQWYNAILQKGNAEPSQLELGWPAQIQ